MIGDVVGNQGLRLLTDRLPELRHKQELDFVVANIENVAGGAGIQPRQVEELVLAGVDVMTSGNHAFDKREIVEYFEREPRLLRPANYPDSVPGGGLWVGERARGGPIAVVNLMGRANMPRTDCQFRKADALLRDLAGRVSVILVDHHAESTSEKMALGRYLDGRVSAVVGTHTHVATADEQVFPGGTAYITDLGMTGAHSGVIGMTTKSVLDRFLTGLPNRLEGAEGDVRLNGAIIEIDPASGKGAAISRLSVGQFADGRR